MNNMQQTIAVVAASVQGTSHRPKGVPCQDAHYFQRLGDGILIGAVADGAGSAKLSEIGSKLASELSVRAMKLKISALGLNFESEAEWSLFAMDVLETTLEFLKEQAEVLQIPVDYLSSTLILVVASKNFVATAHIGDGAVVLKDTAGNISTISKPQNGEYANATTFITSADALSTVQFSLWKGEVCNLALFTDGLQRLALQHLTHAPFEPFFSMLFQFFALITDEAKAVSELERFLGSPQITSRTDDDLTLFLVTL
ncbi:MAG: protein phosphatase 2C domain-containing protein [Pegethrix bostrychoides GSE-TBD4-15B]|jgi:hypothetical protein|uniref:Protein phosphatase 2C domain-containing protein n=1 Tax=Pegethrix bostrychoides GSE-TBD4-15B TaxID=2839662 RepID=A0A951P7X7_9CYAN|nr:protein phosphatase 2C domain-containing protein [Pegethrix bostrychoides GSE-TBD4-15B]